MMKKINWHRLFGLMLMDYLSNRGFDVELEKDLSQKRQLLDVVIVERRSGEADISEICDGFDNLSQHNLLSYKSMQETLNAWAIEELIGHYVNYRKVLGKDRVKADEICLYAVCTRRPQSILSLQGVTEANTGVYDILVLKRKIRIIVLSEIPTDQRNAVLGFFSFNAEKVQYSLDHYHWQQEDVSTVINQLLQQYSIEGIAMPYTMEQFKKDFIMAHLGELDPEMRLKGLDPKDVLSRYDSETRLKGLDPETRLKGLDPETRLKGLDPEIIEAYLKKLKKRKTN
jgi:hypothetical protein